MGRTRPAGLPMPGLLPLPTHLPAPSASSTSPRNWGLFGSEPAPHHVTLAAVLCSWPMRYGPPAAREVVSKVETKVGSAHRFPSWPPPAAPSLLGSAPQGDAAIHLVPFWLSLAIPGHHPTTALLPFWVSQLVGVESPPKQCP